MYSRNQYVKSALVVGLIIAAAVIGAAIAEGAVVADAKEPGSISFPQTITFASGISVNATNGEVVIPKELKLSEASRSFWEGVHAGFPAFRDDLIAKSETAKERDRLRAELEALRKMAKASVEAVQLQRNREVAAKLDAEANIGILQRALAEEQEKSAALGRQVEKMEGAKGP